MSSFKQIIVLFFAILLLSQCKKPNECVKKSISVESADTASSFSSLSKNKRLIIISNDNEYQVIQISTTRGFLESGQIKGNNINIPIEMGVKSYVYLNLDSLMINDKIVVTIRDCSGITQLNFPIISENCDSLKIYNQIDKYIQKKRNGSDSLEIIADGISTTYFELRSTKMDEEVTLYTSAGELLDNGGIGASSLRVKLNKGQIYRFYLKSSITTENYGKVILERCYNDSVIFNFKFNAINYKSDSALILSGDSIIASDTLFHTLKATIQNLNYPPISSNKLIRFYVGGVNSDTLYKNIQIVSPYEYFSYNSTTKAGGANCTFKNKSIVNGEFWLKSEWVGREAIRDSVLVSFR